jgi:hypothetical protein
MENREPIQIVLSFLDRIKAHDVNGICALLTPDPRLRRWPWKPVQRRREPVQRVGQLFHWVSRLRGFAPRNSRQRADRPARRQCQWGLCGLGQAAKGEPVAGPRRRESRCERRANRGVARICRQSTRPQHDGRSLSLSPTNAASATSSKAPSQGQARLRRSGSNEKSSWPRYNRAVCRRPERQYYRQPSPAPRFGKAPRANELRRLTTTSNQSRSAGSQAARQWSGYGRHHAGSPAQQ